MYWLTTSHTVRHMPLEEYTEDSWGAQPQAWGDPIEVAVYGWAPVGADQLMRDLDTGIRRDYDLYAPEPFASPGDRVLLPGAGTFEVVGYPEDYSTGPFGFKNAVRINLLRVEG